MMLDIVQNASAGDATNVQAAIGTTSLEPDLGAERQRMQRDLLEAKRRVLEAKARETEAQLRLIEMELRLLDARSRAMEPAAALAAQQEKVDEMLRVLEKRLKSSM